MKQKKDQVSKKEQPATPNRLAQDFMSAAAEFEKSKIEEIKQSRKLAWLVAGGAGVLAFFSIIMALASLLHRTEPEPFVIKEDASTGVTTTMRSLKDAYDHYDEVVDRHFLGLYVQYCEGYEWFSIGTNSSACKLMSSSSVGTGYFRNLKAPGSPLTVLKDKGIIAVHVTSISFMGDLAQVRFTAQKLTPSGDNPDGAPLQKWIATIGYQYNPKQQMTEQERQINPLGFQVVSYRKDPEVVK